MANCDGAALGRATFTDFLIFAGTVQELAGGVFLNEFLLVNCLVALRRAGFAAYSHQRVLPNDGGIALGQAMVAGARIAADRGDLNGEGGG